MINCIGLGIDVPLLHLINRSPTLTTQAPFTGVAGTKLPGRRGSDTSSPPQSSWKSIVMVLQSLCAGILATVWLSKRAAGIGG